MRPTQVVGCHDEAVLAAVRHAVTPLIELLFNNPHLAFSAQHRRGFLIAVLGASLQDASVLPPSFWGTVCNSVLEALDYGEHECHYCATDAMVVLRVD